MSDMAHQVDLRSNPYAVRVESIEAVAIERAVVVEPDTRNWKPAPLLSGRIPELDGLRGLAILLVLIWHLGYLSNAAGSQRWTFYLKDSTALFWSGVDLFFVLSGFLIGGILLDARESPNYFKAFYIRRIFRIIPVYAVVVVAFYACKVWGLPGRLAGGSWLFSPTLPWYSYATFTQNVRYAAGAPNSAMWFAATWSLAVEEQFYLVMPALILWVSKRLLPYVLAAGIVGAPALRILLNLKYVHGKEMSFFLMPCRADALLLGVLCSLFVRNRANWALLQSRRRAVVSLCMVLLAGLSIFVLCKQTDPVRSFWLSTVGLTALAALYACALLLALVYSRSWFGGLLRIPGLKMLGTISYCAYLIHYPILGLTFAISRGTVPWAQSSEERVLILVALLATLLVASASWTFFEKPLLKIGHSVKY